MSVLNRIQSWGQTCCPARRGFGDPMTLLRSLLKVQSRSLGRLLEDEVCGAVLVLNKPWSAAACSGKGFLLGAIWLWATVCKHFTITSGSKMVFYCFVSMQMPHLQNCLLCCSVEQLRWQICLTSDLQTRRLLWVGNDQHPLPSSRKHTYFAAVPLKGVALSQHLQKVVLCCWAARRSSDAYKTQRLRVLWKSLAFRAPGSDAEWLARTSQTLANWGFLPDMTLQGCVVL